jgi:hypothetical protein
MRTFGSFEAVRELARTGLGQVHAAQKVGETDAKYAVKVLDFGTMSFFADDDTLTTRMALFLESAEVQRNAGAGWVQVHQAVSSSDIAYVAMDQMALSVGRLVEGRSRVDGNVLVSVATGVCDALEAIRGASKRGHGNLKPSNAFFDRSDELGSARVLLSDPAPSSELGADKGEVSDLRALGELLYQLVEHKPFKALGGWPVASSPEWNRLGRVGEGWRELVSELLDPELKPGQISLSDVRERALALRPPKKRVWPLAVAAAAVVAVLVGAWVAWSNRPLPPLNWNQELWAGLVAEDESWFRGVIDQVRAGEQVGDETLTQSLTEMIEQLNDRRIPEWVGPSVQSRATAPVEEGAASVDLAGMARAITDLQDRTKGEDKSRAKLLRTSGLPAIVGSWPAGTGTDLAASKPSSKERETDAMYAIYFAYAAIDRAKAIITERQDSILAELTALKQEGLNAPGFERALRSQVEGARVWEEGAGGVAERLSGLRVAAAQLRDVQGWWKGVDEGVDAVVKGATGESGEAGGGADPVVRVLRAAVGRELQQADERGDAAGFVEIGKAWEERLGKAAEFVSAHGRSEIDWKTLPVREGAAAIYDAARAGELDSNAFAAWLAMISDDRYWLVTEPRPVVGAPDVIAQAVAALGGLDEECADAFSGEVLALQARMAQVRERAATTEALAWIRMNREEVEAAARETSAMASSIREESVGLVDTCGRNQTEEVATWLGEDPSSLTDVAALATYWDRTRRDLASRLAPAPGERPGRQWAALRGVRRVLFGERDRKTDAVLHEGIATQLEAWRGPTLDVAPRGWDSAAMAASVTERRERAAEAMLAVIEPWDPVERFERWAGHEEAMSGLREVQVELAAWAGVQEQMAADFSRVERLISELYLADERPGDGEASIRGVVEGWRAEPSAVLGAVSSILGDVDRLSEIPSLAVRARTSVAEDSSSPAWARFAAWRTLDVESGAWPRGVSELGVEISLRGFAAGEIEKLTDQARGAMLRGELERAGKVRWSTALLSSDAASVAEIMARRSDMGVVGTAEIDPRAAFNIELFDFVNGLEGLPEDQVRSRGRSFRDRAMALDPSARGDARIATLIARVGELAELQEIKRSIEEVLDEVGPRELSNPGVRAKWEPARVDPSGRGEWVTYRSSRLELTFWRVETSSGEPAYVLDREMSVGMLAPLLIDRDVIPAGERISDRWSMLQEDARTGARTWMFDGRRLRNWVTDYGEVWTYRDPTDRGQPAHAQGLEEPPPSMGSPVQWIEATAAEWLAGRIGCRLPTSEEWRAARSAYEQGSGSWNLRDASFDRQREHAAGLRDQGQRFFPWPDDGIFVPRGVAVARGADARAATPGSDGRLWFDEVDRADRGNRLKNLVGNVAEFVNDSAPRPGEPSRGARYGVIGGSALSPPEVEIGTAYPIDGLSGYSDVGFRLAFLAVGAKRPLWRDMADAVGANPPYLFASEK